MAIRLFDRSSGRSGGGDYTRFRNTADCWTSKGGVIKKGKSNGRFVRFVRRMKLRLGLKEPVKRTEVDEVDNEHNALYGRLVWEEVTGL
ncbi:uncharacterized protein RCO7_08375 [Rhynchosporium graminicola]|uniref:Uncharacterized protein n=1 Tax=Rhynchosporium graminicola TaxID=2792576 RepID=A0A1E1KQB9_9HELO|nr:uncharacterized protein RCO7_08375 [Rhynchosporium commune]